jgi:hypothetical protein
MYFSFHVAALMHCNRLQLRGKLLRKIFSFLRVDNQRHFSLEGEIYKIFDEKGEREKVGYYRENEVIGWIRQDLVWGE